MTKAVRELSVIFDKDEVSEIWEIFLADCVARAIHHFVKNEGMSIDEALKRVSHKDIRLGFTDLTLEDGDIVTELSSLIIDVDVEV